MSSSKKKGFKIEPFKHPVKLDPSYGEKTWKVLEDAIHEINNHNASGLSFEELYRNAYNMVINKFGDRLYNGLVETETAHLRQIAAKVEAAQGEGFLRELKLRWEHHNKSMQMVRDILMYMDRIYVKHQNKAPVTQLGLDLWRDCVVRRRGIRERMLAMLLDLIHRERTGDIIDRALLRAITTMLMDLGANVYSEDFEQHFLLKAAEFYQVEAQEYLGSCTCSEYLRKAERRLVEETERTQNYLDPSSEPKITRVVENELFKKQMRALVDMEGSGLVPMLQQDKYEDLGRMYSLFRRVEGGLDLMRSVLGDHIKDTGRALINDPERTKDPVDFVHKLLEEKDKYDRIIGAAFNNDKSFHNVLNTAFEHFLNLSPRAPEYISLFMDDQLRKALKGSNEDDVDATLDRVMMLFRYLQEKDVFEKYYKQHLAKRLLSGRAVSDEAERSLLVKLKTECGYQFTSKLESMFTDIKTSRDTMQDYKASRRAAGSSDDSDIDLSVQVLTTGSWPTQTAAKCNLPRELERCCEEFKAFYLASHSGRKLSWQTNMGHADMKATFGEKRHELNVSTYQMVILLLFNEADSLSYRDIQSATSIPPGDLKRSLQSLACVKGKNVLRKEPMSKEIGESDMFLYNAGFHSKFYKVKIGTVSAQKETEPEKQETRQKVEEDRKPQIEAAVVRIMKARRVLDHNSIVAEVTRQLSARFLPNPTVIKKRIESLIEREFLERDPNDRKLYRYLA
ncbi:Cullin-3 [Coccomyxa sp. Obi]|nr:Cullin-3 [Coccomyxa sp. Obi]